jgi:hypothetical protein
VIQSPVPRALEMAQIVSLLLISHGGTLDTMLPLLLSNVDLAYLIEHPLGYTNPIVVELHDGEWVCLRWGEDVLQDEHG